MNEEDNLYPLYSRCIEAFSKANELVAEALRFKMIIIDNGSSDQTLERIKKLSLQDSRVKGYHNQKTYPPDLSISFAIKQATLLNVDIIISLCSDLQDPPEITKEMLVRLIDNGCKHDSIIAYKNVSSGNKIMQFFRNLYYKILLFSDRDSRIIPGFHGFACYKDHVAKQTLWFIEHESFNLRNALMMASNKPYAIPYNQSYRESGSSSYTIKTYIKEAIETISKGKSLPTRISIRIGIFLFFISFILALFVIINTVISGGAYAGGIPTLTLILMLGFSTQVILLSMLSRQIEDLRFSRSKLDQIISTEVD